MTNVETPKKKARCQFISKIGSRCHADPQVGKDWCFFHDPEQKKKQAEARKQGGEARSRQIEPELKLPPDLPVVSLETAGNIFDLMEQTVHHLQCGKMDIRAARALAYLSSLLLRALKADQPRIATLLADTINQVRGGETDLPTAKTIGHLTSIMLTALKQEAEEQAALQPAESTRLPGTPPSNALAKLARRLGVQFVATPIATAKSPESQQPHPAVLNGTANANTACQPLSS
jgi:hypothetical protein